MATVQLNNGTVRRYDYGTEIALTDGTDTHILNRVINESVTINNETPEPIYDMDDGSYLPPREGNDVLRTASFQIRMASDAGAGTLLADLKHAASSGLITEWQEITFKFPAFKNATAGTTYTMTDPIARITSMSVQGNDVVFGVEVTDRGTGDPWGTYS